MKYKVDNKVRVITDDNCGFGKGYIGYITRLGDEGCYEIDGDYEYCDDEIELARTRGFQRIQGFLDVTLPTRATKFSAGYDIASAIDIMIPPDATAVIPTGVKAYMLPNEFIGLYVRSSIGKLGLTMVTGVSIIDADYYNNPDNEGHIFIILRNDSEETVTIKAGTKLVQGIFHSYLLTDDDEVTAERLGGFGSSGV
jgi:dUTP pyrophosphatase